MSHCKRPPGNPPVVLPECGHRFLVSRPHLRHAHRASDGRGGTPSTPFPDSAVIASDIRTPDGGPRPDQGLFRAIRFPAGDGEPDPSSRFPGNRRRRVLGSGFFRSNSKPSGQSRKTGVSPR